jgi:hypothetical protein
LDILLEDVSFFPPSGNAAILPLSVSLDFDDDYDYEPAPPTDIIPIRLDSLRLAFSYEDGKPAALDLYDWALHHPISKRFRSTTRWRSLESGLQKRFKSSMCSPRAYFYRFQSLG